jgi:hypothetical protein
VKVKWKFILAGVLLLGAVAATEGIKISTVEAQSCGVHGVNICTICSGAFCQYVPGGGNLPPFTYGFSISSITTSTCTTTFDQAASNGATCNTNCPGPTCYSLSATVQGIDCTTGETDTFTKTTCCGPPT